MKAGIVSLAMVLSLSGAVAAQAADGIVKGTATYLERIAMPPGAVFEATLEDISRADAPADVISTVRQENAGSAPYSFELAYDPARIVPSRSYAVRSRVTLEGRLVFTSDQVHPVLTNGNPATVEIVMKRVAGGAGRDAAGKPGDLFASLPATFVGVLPCADCEGIDYHLDIMPDGSYALRNRYLGKEVDRAHDDIGTWALSSDGITLTLKGGREAPVHFSIESAQTLRKLDLLGRPIDSELDYDLRRRTAFEPIEPRATMQGMFTYMADAASFLECTTGRRLPVAMERAYPDLERAYLSAKGEPGQPVMALVEGAIALRPPMEGPSPVPTLLVDGFLRLEPGAACPARFRTARLEGTEWRLVALGEEGVAPPPDGRPVAGLVLRAEDRRAAGSDGCNRFMAGYELEADRLRFTQAASTMMACAEGMEVARRFTEALAAAARWRVLGRQLELYGAEGRLLARLETSDTP